MSAPAGVAVNNEPTRRPPPGFCRDCRRDAPDGLSRCSACGSPRLLRHPELDALAIAHVDCDAFYATIEKRDDPTLADKPVIVGGRQRGVVLTACYVARTFGVRSAMPMFEARRLCPHASVVRPDMEKYARVGREVRALMFKLTPLVEPVSIDEAFMDLSGTARLHGMSPAKALAGFAADVERSLGITVSIGLSPNKFLAKIASDLDKPRGFAVLGATEAATFLAQPRGGPGECAVVGEVVEIDAARPTRGEGERPRRAERCDQVGARARQHRKMEQASGARPHGLPVIRVDAPVDHHGVRAGRVGSPHDGVEDAGVFGFSWANALPATAATAPPTKAVVVPSIFLRFIRPNGIFDSSLIGSSFPARSA